LKPGDLVEIDTVHLMVDVKRRIYVYVLIDMPESANQTIMHTSRDSIERCRRSVWTRRKEM